MNVTIGRRTFLKLAGFASSCALLFTVRIPRLFAGKWERGNKNWWKGEIFHQDNVKTDRVDEGIISANIDGIWKDYKIKEVSAAFMKWNMDARIKSLEEVTKLLQGEEGNLTLAGPHNGVVATYGGGRKDSQFTVNNAVKGMGFVPVKDKLKETIAHLEETISKPKVERVEILKQNYKNEQLFDKTRQVSLELYAVPDFETHTFLNQIENPVCAIVFMDIPCFEIRCIARLIHPDDPDATPYEKDVSHYTNLVHSYFHGEFKKQFIAVIYYVIEEFDNTPGKKKGIRTVPPLPIEKTEEIKKTKE